MYLYVSVFVHVCICVYAWYVCMCYVSAYESAHVWVEAP